MRIGRVASRMDFLGVLCFSYIIIYSIFVLLKGFDVMTLILLLIGIAGLCTDSFITFNVCERWIKKK